MKALFASVVTAAAIFGGLMIHDLHKDVAAREKFVQTANKLDARDGMSFRTSGIFAEQLHFDNVNCQGVDCDEILDQTTAPTDAYDKRYLDLLRELGYKSVCLNSRCVDIPPYDDPDPPVGTRELDYGNAGNS